MQIVIDIPKALYNRILDKCYTDADLNHICRAVTYGSPLPKGHGRLIDADEFEEIADMEFEYIISPLLNHIQTYDVYSLLEATPTIIEADKENNRDE